MSASEICAQDVEPKLVVVPNQSPKFMATAISPYGRLVGRVGALALTLGVGGAVASTPLAFADTTGSADPAASSAEVTNVKVPSRSAVRAGRGASPGSKSVGGSVAGSRGLGSSAGGGVSSEASALAGAAASTSRHPRLDPSVLEWSTSGGSEDSQALAPLAWTAAAASRREFGRTSRTATRAATVSSGEPAAPGSSIGVPASAAALAGWYPGAIVQEIVKFFQLVAITELAKDAYVWGLSPEALYRTSKYNELTAAPVNQLQHGTTPAAWNNSATNAGNASVLYINAELDLTTTDLVYTIPPTNAQYQVSQIIDAFTNTIADPGTRTTPSDDAASFLLVGPNSSYSHQTTAVINGFQFDVITLDTNRGQMLIRLLANSLAEAASPQSAQNVYNRVSTEFYLNTLADFVANDNRPVAPEKLYWTPTAEQLEEAQVWQNKPANAVAFFTQVGEALKLNPLPTRQTGIAGTPLSQVPAYVVPQPRGYQTDNPKGVYFAPSSGQQAALAAFKWIGLTQDGYEIPKGWGPEQIAALQAGYELGQIYIDVQLAKTIDNAAATNYWVSDNSSFGVFPSTRQGYIDRSASTTAGGFTELPADAFYAAAFTNTAVRGSTLSGDNTYSITFTQPQSSYTYQQLPASGIIPPMAKNPDGSLTGFWSVTVYQPDNSEAAAPFLPQSAVLNTAYSQAVAPLISIDTTADTITVPQSDVETLQESTPIMFGSNAATYGLVANTAYYIATTPVQSGDNYTFQISSQWIQSLTSNGTPIQYSGSAGTPVDFTTQIVEDSPLTYGVVQQVSQLGSMQVEDGSLAQNDGTNPAFPQGSYTIWLSPTLPANVPATNWIPTPSTAYLQSIYGDDATVNATIEAILRMYDPQPGNLAPSALPLPRGYGAPWNPKLPSSYVIPPIVTQSS